MLQSESQVALNTVESVEGFLTDVQSGNWYRILRASRQKPVACARTHLRPHAPGVVTGPLWQGRGPDSLPVAAAALEQAHVALRAGLRVRACAHAGGGAREARERNTCSRMHARVHARTPDHFGAA